MITIENLTKRFGEQLAVDNLSVSIQPGKVTGFLGPNGAGKSTTMRMILGLDRPTSGRALIGGRPYSEIPYPIREVGALLDAKALHPGRSARNHLKSMAQSNRISLSRVDEVLDEVGLVDVAGRRAGAYSLGMSQRLGIAGALLGDPGILIFDEPVNGLDPDGVRWVRRLARSLSAEGRTVLVSSHLMSEMQLTADHLVVIGRGRLLMDAPIQDVVSGMVDKRVQLRVPEPDALMELGRRLAAESMKVWRKGSNHLLVEGASAEEIGNMAYEMDIRLHELKTLEGSLEDAYMALTGESVEFGAGSSEREPELLRRGRS
ncbi:MAG TPA: ATP-binding cassette domain-containing protein [Actinomycetota bacterium]|jgi:ABC-2 type transport system ATP-binding protein|nr:ATP-binding cassette domain-containing protein [Actinomycetota bacterium]